ncbi:hypothetical protein K3U94_21740 [Mycolicibacter heraklionensis]|uniref:Uncharacterized protein n=1 Tax=Mycolicibacter heraklionensis TaxID=512402 RepID=A0A9X7WFW1_9MYCO|nr:hypothetical protein [Mycolicibacter heraklionensis]QZA07515.1 hypothetical protein K3U94_21740 [Mycolicibacter heraklionensis]
MGTERRRGDRPDRRNPGLKGAADRVAPANSWRSATAQLSEAIASARAWGNYADSDCAADDDYDADSDCAADDHYHADSNNVTAIYHQQSVDDDTSAGAAREYLRPQGRHMRRLGVRGVYTAIDVATAVSLIAAAVLWVMVTADTTPREFVLVSMSESPPPPAIPLTPNDQGYVRVETISGSTGCSIASELVACQTSADNWPNKPDGRPFHTVSVNANGQFNWVDADLGALAGRVALESQTYSAQGWTIIASPVGTTFTNDRTGHGMSVTDQAVRPF